MILKNDKHRSNLPIVHRVIISLEQKILKGDQMKKKLATGILAGLLLMGTISLAEATPTTLISAGSEWNYATTGSNLWTNWSDVDYSTFAWNDAAWLQGNAAFGNTSTFTTNWTVGTDLALQQTINIDGNIIGLPRLKVAVDNGFILFVNGDEVARKNAEGFTSYWEYDLNIASTSFRTGENTISVFAEDHGGSTFFDMQLTAEVQPVPEPATMLLFGTGLAGLVGAGLKRRRK